MVELDKSLLGHQPQSVFWIFCWSHFCKNHSALLILGWTAWRCANRLLLRQTGIQKMRELYTIYVWRAVWCLPDGLGGRLAQHLNGFFYKNVPENTRERILQYIQAVEEIQRIFVWISKELWALLKNSKSKLKFTNIAVNVLSWAYLMVSLSRSSDLYGEILNSIDPRI